MLAKWTTSWTDERGQASAYDLLDAIIRQSLGSISTNLVISESGSVVAVAAGMINILELKGHGKAFAALASRCTDGNLKTSVSFINLFLQGFAAFAVPSKNKLIYPVVQPLLVRMASLIGTHIDFSKCDKWLDQSALVLVPSPREKRVERVSCLYKETVTQATADTSCIHVAKIGWFSYLHFKPLIAVTKHLKS